MKTQQIISYLPIILFGFLLSCSGKGEKQTADQNKYLFDGEKHIKNLQMLTEGGENAEAYFSFDEKKLIFQATFGDLQCDQIFTMNIDGSDKRMVSTGKGRTTCSYFLPGDQKLIYASTHLADENCPPPPDRSHGYVWQLYNTSDIFMADL
ncbi:MAG: hypothetical protein ACE5GL_11370, partial [Calditrichia bacterium]